MPLVRAPFHLLTVAAAVCAVLCSVACDKKKPTPPPLPPPSAPGATPLKPAAPVTPPPAPARDASLPPNTFADDAALVKALRAGGYIIALRHTHTDMAQKDEQGDDYANCAKQRNLDDQGRADAKTIGDAFKALRLPIINIYSSPFCRNKETAQLIFGVMTINNACMGEDDASVAARAVLLGTRPPAGKNIVMVTHKHSLAKSTGSELETLVEGGALVIVPMGGTSFEVVHTIALDDWKRLAEVARTLN